MKHFFYYKNKWSNSRLDTFGLIKQVGLLIRGLNKRGLLYLISCIKNSQ